MGKSILMLFLVSLAICCKAPENHIAPDRAAAHYAKIIDANTMKDKLYEFSSDAFEGRETGEPGQKKAAQYLVDYYTQHQIDFPPQLPGYLQKVPADFLGGGLNDSENVMAVIEGTEHPEEIVVLSAHYDHLGIRMDGEIYNGADDDGSGTIALLEMAKAFKKASEDGYGPKRTLLFLHFTGEEEGLLGSKYYTENPVYPLSQTVTDLNTDMIGRIDDGHLADPHYIYLIGSDRLSSELDSIVNQQNREHLQFDLDYKYNDEQDPNRFYYRSDHYNFAKHRIPIIFFFSGIHEDYHKVTDTADKIEYELLRDRTRLIFYTAWEVANRNERLKVDK